MSVTSRYRQAWQGFWNETSGKPGEVFWDAEPALTAGVHLALYEPHLTDPALTMVDLGCGNGTQTRFLAGRFACVLGVDLAPAAVEHARRQDGGDGARFRELDAADGAQIAQLHAELGDANVYMRGVLHQCDPQDRRAVAEAIATLVGERGRAFVVELAAAAGRQLMSLAQSPDGPPQKLRSVFRHGIVPGAIADSAVVEFLTTAGLEVLAGGDLPLTTTEYLPSGARVVLPSKWLVLGPNRA
jgi:SAM-dependent methyltransferase